jgi:hypothetical protein
VSLDYVLKQRNFLFPGVKGMKKGLCRLCDQTKDLINAHIIPKSFSHKEFKDGGNHTVFFDVSENAEREATFLQAGVYDHGILCADCEPKFSEFDRYGWEILGAVSLQNPIQDPALSGAYRVFCDTDKLKRFILSVLWRASVSTHSFYSYVSLGPYEDTLKARIFDPTPLAIDEFPTSILYFDQASLGKYEKGILFPPLRERAQDGSNLQVIYLKNLKIYIRVDKRDRERLFDPLLIFAPDSFVMTEFPVKMMKRERSFVPAIMRKMRSR